MAVSSSSSSSSSSSATTIITNTLFKCSPSRHSTPRLFSTNLPTKTKILKSNSNSRVAKMMNTKLNAIPDQLGFQGFIDILQSSPPTWESSLLNNLLIFIIGSPILVTGLSTSGIVSAFLLGTLTWRAFGSSGFLLFATYFVIGTAATKVKMAQKEAQGVAEKRKGRRGPSSVIGSSAAGFVVSFCTKLSDTVSSEVGKAYGKTTYLVTSFKVVPRGTEGAVSVEGTVAGLLASMLLAIAGFYMGEVSVPQAVICVVASQIANLGESLIGAALQDKEGFRWLNNDVVNVINMSLGSIFGDESYAAK
ncbi:hypothetical protein MKX01_021169 [Papaver californicum]|nr:hypothetical protein MKX01_021169 [Papaver californicum]